MSISRKQFLKQAGAVGLGFSGLYTLSGCAISRKINPKTTSEAFGPLIADPEDIFDLPDGFSYKIISRFGDTMDDGFYVPHRPDGMATFEGPGGETILIRNHEVNPARGGDESAFGSDFALTSKLNKEDFYDPGVNNNPGQGHNHRCVRYQEPAGDPPVLESDRHLAKLCGGTNALEQLAHL
ncbi:MAG: DUF839 domain-containing protein [Balneolaceae bacterium]|nr:DUF839 domain-containing protein [Balneolaceae bacterium]